MSKPNADANVSASVDQTVHDILTTAVTRNPVLKQEIEWLILETLEWPRVRLITEAAFIISASEKAMIASGLARLENGEPLAYILGHQDFYKYRFLVTPAVLIPRADTELLVKTTLEFLRRREKADQGEVVVPKAAELKIADLGVGSGCIGLSLLMELPQARLWACDISHQAIRVFRKNVKALGLEGRVLDSNSDVSENMFENEYDTIVANPPYIARDDDRLEESVRLFEPATALFADQEGLSFYQAWIPWSFKALRKSGAIVFEFGEGQGEAVLNIAQVAGFEKVELKKDLSGKDRVLFAVKE